MSDHSPAMTGKPRLKLIYGDQDQLARKILSLIISPDSARHEAEIDRLMSMLKRRGKLSTVIAAPPFRTN